MNAVFALVISSGDARHTVVSTPRCLALAASKRLRKSDKVLHSVHLNSVVMRALVQSQQIMRACSPNRQRWNENTCGCMSW
jgi:hypothetical protein